MKWYGSIDNRIEENKMLVDKIEVGTLATEFLYSDRVPYEVIEVKDNKHIKIRQLKAKRIDNNCMSENQLYEYSSNELTNSEELVYRYNHWYRKCKMYTENKYYFTKINITFGYAEKYYDYSF